MSDKSTEVALYQLPAAPAELEAAFISTDFTDRLIESIRTNAKSLVADVTTAKGRKALISMSATVRSSKVAIDNAGKNLVAEMKKRPALVDESRRKIREALDELAVEIRQPVTEYEEAEAARLEAIKIALLHDEALIMNGDFDKARAEKFEADHELALLMNDKFDSDKIEAERRKAAKAEQARLEEEKRIKDEANRKAKDTEHHRQVNNEILSALTELGASDEFAKALIKAIATNKIPNVKINY